MQIYIPTPLRPFAGKQAAVTISATTVGSALSALITEFPELRKHLYTEEGKLRAFVNVYLNDEDIRYLDQKENTPIKGSDSLSIIPSIAGGVIAVETETTALPKLSADEMVTAACLPAKGRSGVGM